jgi:hypothetical protein
MMFIIAGLSEYFEHMAWPPRGKVECPDVELPTSTSINPVTDPRV